LEFSMKDVFKLISSDSASARVEFHNNLNLTGCEVSVNNLPAGGAVPFVHSHKNNEEFYYVISGEGEVYVDGSVISIKTGDAFRIDPCGHRAIRALDTGLRFICVQARANSLEGFTADDAEINDDKAPWLK